jgi:hypothetical protein
MDRDMDYVTPANIVAAVVNTSTLSLPAVLHFF